MVQGRIRTHTLPTVASGLPLARYFRLDASIVTLYLLDFLCTWYTLGLFLL